MVGWFTARRHYGGGAGQLRRIRPCLEQLETRDCPSAAVITSLSAVSTNGQTVQISGTVQDESPGGCVVQTTGAASIAIQVNADGTFTATVPVSSVTVVQAKATDPQGLISDPVETKVDLPPQILNFVGTHGTGNYWTFTGKVVDESPLTCHVQLGGVTALQTATVQINADGTFAVTVEMPPTTWVATAQATDALGQVSNIATWPCI